MLWGLAACNQQTANSQRGIVEGLVVKCTQSLPEFTTGRKKLLTKGRDPALCSSVWGRLQEWGKEVSTLGCPQGQPARLGRTPPGLPLKNE